MKTIIKYLSLCTLLVIGASSCKKTSDVPAVIITDSTKTTVVGGVTSVYKDTVVYTVNNVTIKYSRTSQCYPSNEIFAFSASGSDLPTGAIYNWDFGDGHTLTGNANVGNIYQDAGHYTITLTITDANKYKLSTTTVNILAFGQQATPHASFYAQIFDINYPNNYNFNANGSNAPRGHIDNYLWNWGDGTTTSAATPDNTPHNFAFVARDTSYPVKLIVTSSAGCKDTATVPVSIAAIYSISGGFDTLQRNACAAESFTFTSNATGVPANAVYTWDFGDASGIVTGNPIQHSFTYQNTNGVTMYVNVNGKVVYTKQQSVWSNGQNIHPAALFFKNISYEDTTYVKWAMYSAANVPHGYINSYEWFMDNTPINPYPNFNETFETYAFQKTHTTSTHTIKFIVTSNVGCKDTAISTIPIPVIGKYTY